MRESLVHVYEVTERKHRSRNERAVAAFFTYREAVEELHRREAEANDELKRRVRPKAYTREQASEIERSGK